MWFVLNRETFIIHSQSASQLVSQAVRVLAARLRLVDLKCTRVHVHLYLCVRACVCVYIALRQLVN